MARVNHKSVRQLLNEERGRITDRQFFVSRLLAGHFSDIAAAQSRRYGYRRRIQVRLVWEPHDDNIASTDNAVVTINAGHPLVTHFTTRLERYQMVCGLFTHELGHVLYTDFLAMQTGQNRSLAGLWYPEQPEFSKITYRLNAQEIEAYRTESGEHGRQWTLVAHELLNILEDGYIEDRLLREYPGILGDNLEFMRQAIWENALTVTQLIEQETDERLKWLSLCQIILDYALYGEIPYGETPLTDERIQAVFACLPDIDTALYSTDARIRWDSVNRLLIRNWPIVKAYLDYCEENGGEDSSLAETMMRGLQGVTARGSGVSEPVESSASAARMPTNGSPRETRRRYTAQNASTEETKGEEPPGIGEGSASEEPPRECGPDKEGEPLQEQDRIPYHQTDTISTPHRGGMEWDESYAGLQDKAAAQAIQDLLTRMAETRLEIKRTDALNELAQNISYGDAHEGVKITIRRISEVDASYVEQYNQVAPPLLTISRQLQRSVVRELQDKRRGGKETGLYMGRRLDVHALHRNDGRVFYKNSLPNEMPELAVALLLDESGSMRGDRTAYARAAAIILYDFCSSLHIPVMAYGHSTDDGVCMYSYAEFETIDCMDRYRMMDISARHSNRDGAALRYVAERLSKRPEDAKLLILVSDGQPADTGYSGTAAEEDLRGIKEEYRRKGVRLIAAAIGDDKEAIGRIYGESFLNISDLTQLPVTLTAMVKRYVRA